MAAEGAAPGERAVGADILFEDEGGPVPVVTLNRPRALNALTYDMCLALLRRLAAWRDDPKVSDVVIKGTGERAFCAGGDIRSMYEMRRRGEPEACLAFYRAEYRMNWRVHHFPKPWIAFLDGITMGGGVGLSVHGSHRIATENTVFAMPETGIGLFPDVGATYVLPRLPGAVGMYMGLTGARLDGADCFHVGIATYHVHSAQLPKVERALRQPYDRVEGEGAVDTVLEEYHLDPGPSALERNRERIDSCFSGGTLEEVLAALKAEPTGWGAEQLAILSRKSPTSLRVTFRQLRLGADLDFDDAMRLEYRLVRRFMAGHDFFEGVRALIIDKDNAPRWDPEALERVGEADVDAYFAPPPEGDLRFDWNPREAGGVASA